MTFTIQSASLPVVPANSFALEADARTPRAFRHGAADSVACGTRRLQRLLLNIPINPLLLPRTHAVMQQ
jgi:hypothetical protein